MTREEAIEVLRKLLVGLMDLNNEQKWDLTEALGLALTALRGPTREMVERMRGEWVHDGPNFEGGTDWYHCSKCGAKETGVYVKYNFCSHCGQPKTDEAVDMVLEMANRCMNLT